jgi:hemerythrin-like domain-containing protein
MGDHTTEIDVLIDEHRELMRIMAALTQAMEAPDADREALLDRLETMLGHHTEREESGLFHVLQQVEVPPRYIGLFEHDHTHMVDLVHAARDDRSKIDDLLNDLGAHMAREEDDMFPAAEQLLGPAHWDAVEVAVAGRR